MQKSDLFIQFESKKVVKISTVYDSARKKREIQLQDVADLMGAFVSEPYRQILGFPASISLADLSLCLPDGVPRWALNEDCFDTEDENDTSLRSGLALSLLGVHGSNDRQPLVIKSAYTSVVQNQGETNDLS